MPSRDMPPVGATDEFDGAEFNSSAFSIAHDFATLAEIFERQLKLVAPSDDETRSRIAKAKEAAERGARLSQELIRQSKSGS